MELQLDKDIQLKVAIVDDEEIFCKRVTKILRDNSCEVETFLTGQDFLKALSKRTFDLILLDLYLPDINGLKILEVIQKQTIDVEVIVITGHGSIDSAVQAIKCGANNYLCKPISKNDLLVAIRSSYEKILLRRENRMLKEAIKQQNLMDGFVANCPKMQEVLSTVKKVAYLDCNILIQGETGTGKEMIARAIHSLSPRKNGPFIAFNCGAFSEELIANELFGHERGAFTGAISEKRGLLEVGSGGTVFLDEIAEMSLSMQVKLLRVLEEKKILRLGATKPIDIDIRIIAATNKDLKQMVQEGKFREDLFYRLNVVEIKLPKLIERKEDLPLLIAQFIAKYNKQFGKKVKSISPQALSVLKQYDFPGNVRELENIIQRAVALSDDEVINVKHLPADLQHLSFEDVDDQILLPLEEVERMHILKVLKFTGYDRKMTAAILGLSRVTLWRKMKKYGL